MPNATDFMSAVYVELAKLLNITEANPTIVMQMAWPGFSLTAQDFKALDQPDGPYDPQVARETFSHLANIAPGLSKTYFQNSGLEVDDLYEILVTGAIPGGSTLDSIGSNPIYKLFSDAQYEFLQARTGRSGDLNTFYYPSLATPTNWYDETAAQFWPTLSMQSGATNSAAVASSVLGSGTAPLFNRDVWKLRPASIASADLIKQVAQQVVVRQQRSLRGNLNAPIKAVIKPLSAQTVNAVRATPVAAHGSVNSPANVVSTRTPMFATQLATAKLQSLFSLKTVPQSCQSKYQLGGQIQGLDLTQKKLNLGRISVANRFQLSSLINQELQTKPAGSSDGFNISFKYCRVNIDRSWFKLALLKMKSWYMFGTLAGEYSSGSSLNNPGMFPLLPTSFIAIRDLRITANWSQEDRQNIDQATALGFFDIRDATLNANTLEVKGLQILGWISTLMPQLPPMPSP